MLTILLTHKSLDQYKIKARAELHIDKMDGNKTYADLQPEIETTKSAFATYASALLKSDGGSSEDKEARRIARTNLDTAITLLAKGTEYKANKLPKGEDEAFAKGAGFVVKQPSVRKNLLFLEKPTNLVGADVSGFDGAAKASWIKNEDTVSVCIEFQLTLDAPWQTGPSFTASSGVITGLPSGTYVYLRIYGMGRKGLRSDATASVRVLVS